MSREYCNAKYRREECGHLDSANANQFKLFDDFASGVTIRNFSSIRVGGGCDNRAPDITIPRTRDADDSGVDMENGNPLDDIIVPNDNDMLENEVMVDPWSSMESSNSPVTDSAATGGSADTTPSPSAARPPPASTTAAPRPRHLPLALPPNADLCRIPPPHFLDHSPSPSPDLDRLSDLTNPNFLDDDALDICDDSLQATSAAAATAAGAPPERPGRPPDAPRAHYRTHLHYGLGAAPPPPPPPPAERRASQLYRGTWPGDGWPADTASVRSFSSSGSARASRPSADIDTKIDCVYSLLSLLSLSPDNNADLSGPLLEMSRSPESCGAMRQSGCVPLLVQLVHSTQPRETRNRAAQALRNIIHAQTDDKAGRREARVWRLLERVREYCYVLEDSGAEAEVSEHPSQCVAALMKLSFDEEHRHVVCQLGGLQALARLVSADQAAHGSRAEDGACVTMRKYAGMTLTNLTFGDGNNKSLLCSFKEFMMALVEQLQSPNDDMRQVTSAVLRNLSWRADTNSKQVLREVGAVKGLTEAAMTCQKEATLKSVLSALWNLTAHCSMNKVALCSVDGALGFLVDMLSYNSPTKTLAIVENAGGIMRNVSSHIAIREDYRQILRERNCLSVLLQHLKSPSLTVVSNSCGTLWNLSARCPLDQQFLWDQGAVPMLRSLIHSKHKMIAMGSSAALKNLLNSKPGKNHIISLDSTARSMNLPVLPTLGVRKQKALEQELDQNLAETCDNIEPANSPSTTNRDEKNLFSATERQLAMNLERHRMTSSSPLMGALGSQNSLSHSAHLAGYLSCSNTLLKGTLVSRSVTGSTTSEVNRSDSRDSVTSTHSDTALERTRTAKVPIPTPRSKDIVKTEDRSIKKSELVKGFKKTDNYQHYPVQPPIPPPRSGTDVARNNFTESGYDVDNDSCDQPIDFSRKYSEAKSNEPPSGQLVETAAIKPPIDKGPREKKKYPEKDAAENYGDYQETDLDQPTDYSLRYAEHQSETSSDISEPPGPSVHEDTIQHFCTEGTPYETPIIFSTATSISDLRVIGSKEQKNKIAAIVKPNPEVMTQSDEKDTCSIEEPPRHDNDVVKPASPPGKSQKSQFDTKFSSGMISPEKPVNYCEEGTPGCFSRVSSLSSLGDLAEETSLAKKNAMATINVDMDLIDKDLSNSAKDKDGSKAVTFACSPEPCAAPPACGTPPSPPPPPPPPPAQRFVEDTPLVFSRCSSPSSLSGCSVAGPLDEQGSVISEISRLTSGCISPSELPDSPGQSVPQSPRVSRPPPPHAPPGGACADGDGDGAPRSVFEERVSSFRVEHTPAHFSTATSLSSLTIDDEPPAAADLAASAAPPAPAAPHRTMSEQAECGGRGGEVGGAGRIDGGALRRSDRMSPQVAVVLGTVRDVGVVQNISSQDGAYAAEAAAVGAAHDTSSDSSNLSDTGEHLLHECIQRGIAGVVKNGSHGTELTSPPEQYLPRDQLYRSLPPYLRGSTETVRAAPRSATAASLSPERGVERPLSSDESPPPPLPPKPARTPPPPPPRPPAPAPTRASTTTAPASPPLSLGGSDDERIFNQAVQQGIHQLKEKKHESRLPVRTSHRDRPRAATSNLARTDSLSSLSIDSFGSTDREIFEECVQAGVAKAKDLAHRPPEHKAHSAERVLDAAPRRTPRVPRSLDRARARPPPPLDRSDSLSSLSGDSFGSTDKEVFERCVRLGANEGDPAAESHRSRRRRPDRPPEPPAGALDRMTGEEDSRDRALLEEMIARGAGELRPTPSKNVPAPSAARAPADGSDAASARPPSRRHRPRDTSTPRDGSDSADADEVLAGFDATIEACETDRSNELPTVDSCNTTLESGLSVDMDRSNEYRAAFSANTTFESEAKDLLDRSNESYADVLDGSAWSDVGSPPVRDDCATLTRSNSKPANRIANELTSEKQEEYTRRGPDTWNDNTCPDDVTFPTISGSVPMVASFKSDAGDVSSALPDLLEETIPSKLSFPGPDLTDQLEKDRRESLTLPDKYQQNCTIEKGPKIQNNPLKFESMSSSTMIEKEAAELAAQLKNGFYFPGMDSSAHSFDLDSVKPPSNMGSLVSLSVSTNMEEIPRKRVKNRKKSLPVALMVKRALTNSMTYHSSSEHLDSCPVSILDNVKPPSELEHMDMESSIISVSSIVSEVAEHKGTIPVLFDFDQPISGFSLLNNFNNPMNDLDHVNPPSLFDEMMESTLEFEQTTAQEVIDDAVSNTLNILTDFASGSENCSPLPSDISSVETTPKKVRNEKYLTPKEKRQLSKERYNTYTIADEGSEPTDVTIAIDDECGSDLTLESDSRSEYYVTAQSDHRSRRKMSAKQRRQEDRARYQTQTVNIGSILSDAGNDKSPDPEIEDLRRRLAAKKSIRQRRLDDAERFRTRTIDDVPPSPTYVTSDANFENVETTTGYDSLSSADLNHQQLTDERGKESDGNSTEMQADSGTNDDDFELNTTQMQTYTRSFRNYLPVIESPSAVDICVVNNLKNIELTASYRRTPTSSFNTMRAEPTRDASTERDSDLNSDSEPDPPLVRAKPKIIKPTQVHRDDSLDSNGSCDEPSTPKAIRGRRKPAYISPYKRNVPRKSPNRTVALKSASVSKPQSVVKPSNEKPLISGLKPKTPPKSTTTSRIPNNISPKKTTIPAPQKPSTSQKTDHHTTQAGQPLPIERQGTFTKEESTVLPKESASPNKKTTLKSNLAKATTSTKSNVNTSPSRLPQPKSLAQKPQLRKTLSNEVKPTTKRPSTAANRASFPAMKNSPSNQSLQSNESTKTVTLASRGARHGSASSVNSPPTKGSKDVASRIANLWKKVEQSKRTPSGPDRRVWISGADAPDPSDPPKLLRSSTFEGQPKEIASVSAAPKTKSSIAIRVSQIPSGRFTGRAGPSRQGDKAPATTVAVRRAPVAKVFARKQLNGQEIAT